MKKIFITILALVSLSSISFALDKDQVKKNLSELLRNTTIVDIRNSEIDGLYEVVTPTKILYTDVNGKYLIVGQMFTLEGINVTQNKINQLLAEQMDKIDTSFALKIGNGKIKVIEFTDPECPYCKQAQEFFKGNNNTTRYIFFFPLPFHPNAKKLSIHVLCSEDKESEYKKVFEGNFDLNKLNYCKEGEEQLNKMMALGNELNITGTPTFYIKGKMIPGASPEIAELIK